MDPSRTLGGEGRGLRCRLNKVKKKGNRVMGLFKKRHQRCLRTSGDSLRLHEGGWGEKKLATPGVTVTQEILSTAFARNSSREDM